MPAAHPSVSLSPADTHKVPSASTWITCLSEITLDGLPLALLQLLHFEQYSEQTLTLTVAKKHKALLQSKPIQAITDALTAYYEIPLTLEISIAEATPSAPANKKNMQKEEKKGENALIEKIMTEFDAKIIKTLIIR